MGRHRSISTDISTDAAIASLAAEHGAVPVLLYTWAIPHADDWGRLSGDAVQFRLTVCPGLDVSIRDVDEALDQVARAGLWSRYEADGKRCLAFPQQTFYRHQSYIPKAKREKGQGGSAFPPPPQNPEEHRTTPQNPEEHRTTPQNPEEHRTTPQNPASPSPSPSPSGSPFASLRDCGDDAEPDEPGADAPTTAKASSTSSLPDTEGRPSGEGASGPCWDSWPLGPERDFCRLLGLDTDAAVEAARVWGQFGQMRRLYGPGLVAEAVLSAELKSPPGGWASPQDALRYVRGAAKGEKSRMVAQSVAADETSAELAPAAVVDHAARYVALAVDGLGPDGRPLEPEPPPAGPFVPPPWSKRAKAAAATSRGP